MRAYVSPPSHLSKAMFRVSKALEHYILPSQDVQIVYRLQDADMQVAHVIDFDALTYDPGIPFVVIQYCTNALSEQDMLRWQPLWKRAHGVWSYYDLGRYMPDGANFFHSPLGIDEPFRQRVQSGERTIGVMTSGFVHGPSAEAIEEVLIAARKCKLNTTHLGPMPVGMSHIPKPWVSVHGVGDQTLASLYSRTQWVSGLRHMEGFELPCIEALACGARPIVFDRPDMRQWYNGYAHFVKESQGEELVEQLVKIFSSPVEKVSEQERREVLQKFNWETIVPAFWEKMS